MHDKPLDLAERQPHLMALMERLPAAKEDGQAVDEDSCPAFGFLRGNLDRALAVEFRFRNGNSICFPYSWLGPWRFNPSVGLLLKFTGDVTTLVLIRGSNLDLVLPHKSINLTDRGFQRHRILWVREMSEDELQKTGESGPSIDRIAIVEFESPQEAQEWMKDNAALFLGT